MERRPVLGLHAVAAVGAALALFAPWWRASALVATVSIRLRDATVCVGGDCETRSLDGAASAVGLVTTAFAAAVIAAVVLRTIAILAGRESRAAVLATAAAGGALLVAVIATIASHRGEGVSVGDLSYGALGAVGAGACALWSAIGRRAETPLETSIATQARAAPRHDRPPPSAAVARAAGALQAAKSAGRAGFDVGLEALRFVVKTAVVDADGIAGDGRRVAWADCVSVRARRLPPDPPYERALLVDLVPRSGGPLRLLVASRVDYKALPGGGTGVTAKERLRHLLAHVRACNAAVEVDDGTAAFIAGAEAPTFAGLRLFAEYDAAYGEDPR